MKTIMLQDRHRSGEPDELMFVNPHHIVWVKYDPQDADGGSLVRLVTGQTIYAWNCSRARGRE